MDKKAELSFYAQSAYHAGCAARHLWRALVALPGVVIGLLIGCMLLGILAACAGCHIVPALKPGRAAANLSTPTVPAGVSVQTPENPSTPTAQSVERTTTRRYASPAQPSTDTPRPATPVPTAQPEPILVEETTREIATATVGASHQDTSRDTAARLTSFRPVQFAGIGFLLFAAALFHPVARAAVGGGKSVQMALAVGGLVLIFGPTLFVGRESLVLLLVCCAIGVWWLHSRATYHEAKADAATAAK